MTRQEILENIARYRADKAQALADGRKWDTDLADKLLQISEAILRELDAVEVRS